MRKRPLFVYLLLAACWCAIVLWQAAEHRRVIDSIETLQLSHVNDLSTSLGVVIRSQRRWGGTVSRERLIAALEDLASSRELMGIALLNPTGEIIAAGGEALPETATGLAPGTTRREGGRLLAAALVELGTEPPPPRSPRWRRGGSGSQEAEPPGAVLYDRDAPPRANEEPQTPVQRLIAWERLRQAHLSPRVPISMRPRSAEQQRELYEKSGLHTMVLMLNDGAIQEAITHDLLLRLVLAAIALAAAVGLGLAWRSVTRSAELHVRLVRARAMNSYLQELNLAAAGLAHETRNPLNVVRGITQVVARDAATSAAARGQLEKALEEVDRITVRLNEFLDYSKPREPQLSPVQPLAIATEVAHTLQTDLEDKRVNFSTEGPALEIAADPAMLRQVLFNLLLNAVQALPEHGHLLVRLTAESARWQLEVIDDGPGLPPEVRGDIFRPYFSLNDSGTGLGLAIVRQIALAHGWEVHCLQNPPGGCIFRIVGLQPAARAS